MNTSLLNHLGGLIAILTALTKIRITMAVTLTTGAGYLLAAREARWEMLAPLLGTFLLAAGASAINQWQEADIDARMPRTCRRPIPAGRIRRAHALVIAGLLMLAGMAFLASADHRPGLVLALGALAAVWYNGLYVYLKRVTALAVLPGALTGAVPPLIGWSAAGGSLTDPLIVLAVAFFWIWQIPHFWLLLLMRGDEYAAAGLPTLTKTFSRPQLFRVTFVWMVAAAVAGMVIPAVAHAVIAWPWAVAMVAVSFWLVWNAFDLVGPKHHDNPRLFHHAFMRINIHALGMAVCLSAGALW